MGAFRTGRMAGGRTRQTDPKLPEAGDPCPPTFATCSRRELRCGRSGAPHLTETARLAGFEVHQDDDRAVVAWAGGQAGFSYLFVIFSALYPLRTLPPIPQRPPRPGPGVLALVEDEPAVDEDVRDPLAVLERLEVRRPVGDPVGVEEGDVGVLAGAEQAPVAEA